jgi:hypothetical protein
MDLYCRAEFLAELLFMDMFALFVFILVFAIWIRTFVIDRYTTSSRR